MATKTQTTLTTAEPQITQLTFPGFAPEEIYVYEADNALVDGADLVGVPFIVMNWQLRDSRFSDVVAGDPLKDGKYITVEVILQDGSLRVFNNSAAWPGCIRDVLQKHYQRTGSRRGLMAPRGLRAGENKKGSEPIYAFA